MERLKFVALASTIIVLVVNCNIEQNRVKYQKQRFPLGHGTEITYEIFIKSKKSPLESITLQRYIIRNYDRGELEVTGRRVSDGRILQKFLLTDQGKLLATGNYLSDAVDYTYINPEDQVYSWLWLPPGDFVMGEKIRGLTVSRYQTWNSWDVAVLSSSRSGGFFEYYYERNLGLMVGKVENDQSSEVSMRLVATNIKPLIP